jgi:hypothetical protein
MLPTGCAQPLGADCTPDRGVVAAAFMVILASITASLLAAATAIRAFRALIGQARLAYQEVKGLWLLVSPPLKKQFGLKKFQLVRILRRSLATV